MRRPGVKRLFRFPSRNRAAVGDDVREEVEFHIDMRTEDLMKSGATEAEARARALQEFGDRRSGEDACFRHDHRVERRRAIARILSECRQDARLGFRLIARNPWYSAAAILTLTVAIGGNTAIFSVANALLLKPLPVRAPMELARVRAGESQMSWMDYRDLAERNGVFAEMVAHRRVPAGLVTGAAPVRLWGEQTTTNYFSVLGASAALGRAYMPFDTRRDLLVLAHRAWHTRFAADPAVIGRSVLLNGRSYEIIGVMPRLFRGVAPAGLVQDFWSPIDDAASNALLADRNATRFEAFGRLLPGVSHAQAETALATVAGQIRAEHPGIRETFLRMEVFPLDGLGSFRGMGNLVLPVLGFVALMTVVTGLVLLIGCANLGGLLLGRAAARRKEIAVRLALGAGRGRLVRQLLMESLVLALLGGAGGVLLAMWATAGVNPFLSRLHVPMEFDLRIDRRVLMYALAASTLAALVFGLAPARRAARFDLVSSLKDEASGSAVPQRLRRLLVVGQVAVCSILLVWTGLFVRSLGNIRSVDPGFDPDGVLIARLQLDEMTHSRAFGERLSLELEQEVEQSPGVESAAIATVVPLSLDNEEFDVVRDGDGGARLRVLSNRLTPGWFDTLRIPIIAGRDFTAADRAGAPLVAIVNETLAREFRGGGAIGQQLRVPGRPDRVVEVVGIVRDSKYWTLGEDKAPVLYLPFRQGYSGWLALHVRTRDRRSTLEVITRYMQRRAPDVFVEAAPLTDTLTVAVLPARIGAAVTSAFGIVAMLLAALGVYGLVAISVAQRTREMGIRKAVGASTPDLVRMVVGEHLLLTLTGLGVGMALGVAGANLLRTFIAGVSPTDPIALVASAAAIFAAALVASALPALRAALVNPLLVLRDT